MELARLEYGDWTAWAKAEGEEVIVTACSPDGKLYHIHALLSDWYGLNEAERCDVLTGLVDRASLVRW